MKRVIGFLTLALTLISCGQTTEEYLYNEHHKDWQAVKKYGETLCKEGSAIFKAFKQRGDFKKYYDEGQLYRVSVKKAKWSEAENHYIKLENVQKEKVTILYSYNNGNTTTEFEYTNQQNNKLVSGLANGACETRKDYVYKASNLGSSKGSTFTDTRKEKVGDKTRKIIEVFSANVEAPLALIAWNRTFDDSDQNGKDEYKLTKIDQDDCDSDDKCDFISSGVGTININENAWQSNSLNSELINLQGLTN